MVFEYFGDSIRLRIGSDRSELSRIAGDTHAEPKKESYTGNSAARQTTRRVLLESRSSIEECERAASLLAGWASVIQRYNEMRAEYEEANVAFGRANSPVTRAELDLRRHAALAYIDAVHVALGLLARLMDLHVAGPLILGENNTLFPCTCATGHKDGPHVGSHSTPLPTVTLPRDRSPRGRNHRLHRLVNHLCMRVHTVPRGQNRVAEQRVIGVGIVLNRLAN
jgi:hypothetical protein